MSDWGAYGKKPDGTPLDDTPREPRLTVAQMPDVVRAFLETEDRPTCTSHAMAYAMTDFVLARWPDYKRTKPVTWHENGWGTPEIPGAEQAAYEWSDDEMLRRGFPPPPPPNRMMAYNGHYNFPLIVYSSVLHFFFGEADEHIASRREVERDEEEREELLDLADRLPSRDEPRMTIEDFATLIGANVKKARTTMNRLVSAGLAAFEEVPTNRGGKARRLYFRADEDAAEGVEDEA